MKTYLKFACIYCGQHMECSPCLAGRQILCPTCLHRIVIPTPSGDKPPILPVRARHTWDTYVPLPSLEIPTRHHHRMPRTAVLAQAA
jgi:DNA-directed RNA polymerase subunit RPC12/RpoP